jgi:hypothetical protein
MDTLATLPETFGGQFIRPGDARYDEARSLFNGAIDRRPLLIARCTGPEDVQLALRHAREQELVVAVRGGGHSSPGYSCCDDGVVIDVSPMKRVEIDVDRRTGRFGAGLTWGELDAATQAHGLAVTGGRVTHTGVAGLSLGSGSGWLERLLGPTCASLISAEVVTADGRILRASAEENQDLLWGLKGGGGNFGVVTEFEFRLRPVGPIVYGGMIVHPREMAGDLLRFYRDFMESAPDEVGGGFAFFTTPPDDRLPEQARGVPAAMLIVVHAGDPVEGHLAGDRAGVLTARRRDGPDRARHDGARDAGRDVELLLSGHVERSGVGRAGDRMGEGVRGRHAAVVRGQGAAQLHRRRR